MLSLTIEDIILRIEKGEIFEAISKDGGFRIAIKEYVPYVCTAIHDGHAFRNELKLKTALSDYERWYEEDPYTADFISSMPIVLAGKDSRFEYDLNRKPETCIYKEAWGKKVWNQALTKAEKERSLAKHRNYYRVTHALISKLESLFDGCVVYDMHSYNYKRWDREVPVFNIGAELIDEKKFGKMVKAWKKELASIELPNGIENKSAINDVFYGRGYNLEYITQNFKKTLVLATEVSKIYCNEENGEPYPEIIKRLKESLKRAIVSHAQLFADKFTNWKHDKKSKLLSHDVDQDLKKVDNELHVLLKSFELLSFVNPTNVEKQKKKFFDSRGTENPDFTYRPINIDTFGLKRKLHRLELEKIQDIHLQRLYEGVINAFSDKIDMLASLGTERFLYNSLRYFGEPNEADMRNAWFLQHLPPVEEPRMEKKLGVNDAIELFKKSFAEYGFVGKIEVSKHLVADAMVSNSQKKVILKKGATFSEKGLQYLMHHEIGVHMVTTMNCAEQPLKILSIGMPVNTKTQEGLAVLSEYLSGNIMMKRLKELGQRVIATEMLSNGATFVQTYQRMVQELRMDVNEAFYLVTRIYRGGGFTKDHLYLRGLKEIYNFWSAGNDLRPLLLGKTSIEYYPTIVELLDRGILNQPKYITQAFANPRPDLNDPIYAYIIKGIR